METNEKPDGDGFRPAVGLALLSLLVCGLFFPLLITGVAQVLFPYQANGEILQVGGQSIGSNLIAQGFSQPIFFHPRNDSASKVDPDITVQDAYSQAVRISQATGIPVASLRSLVDNETDLVSIVLEAPFVNVLALNMALIHAYPSVYGAFA